MRLIYTKNNDMELLLDPSFDIKEKDNQLEIHQKTPSLEINKLYLDTIKWFNLIIPSPELCNQTNPSGISFNEFVAKLSAPIIASKNRTLIFFDDETKQIDIVTGELSDAQIQCLNDIQILTPDLKTNPEHIEHPSLQARYIDDLIQSTTTPTQYIVISTNIYAITDTPNQLIQFEDNLQLYPADKKVGFAGNMYSILSQPQLKIEYSIGKFARDKIMNKDNPRDKSFLSEIVTDDVLKTLIEKSTDR